MIQGKQRSRWLAFSALVAVVALVFIVTIQGTTHSQNAPGGEASNMRLVGYNDLQGRESLEVHVRSNDANGSWAYVGHSNNYWGEEMHMNSITGKMEHNGTSILDVSDPANPKLVWHIPNEYSANSRHVGVVYDYQGTGRDYLVRSSDDGGENMMFQVFDITTRDSDPSQIKLVSEIRGTPRNSCGVGCGGRFISRAHKGYWSEDSGYYYTSAGEPGFRTALIQIWDLKDPASPKFVSRMWIPGQKNGELGFEGQYAHHPIVDEENNRVYAGFRGPGQVASWDISNIANPELVWMVDTSPPGRGPHTVSPIVYNQVPNFKDDALPRTYAFVTDEAGGSADSKPCTSGVRSKAYMFDITDETHPFPVDTWLVPTGNFCDKGGRFGPHQHAETRNGRINRFEDKLAWVAYFNAGVRVVDISDPYNLKEVGSYIPEENENSHPMSQDQPTAIQINDVDVDHRGLGYATDRVGTGLFILEYTGPKPGSTTD
ncbi:MAG TPA: hypothetical protein VGC53_07570 [Vicinamibacteria bacterium]|jgi:hypothetical protein